MDDAQKDKIKKFPIKEYALNKEKLGSLTFDRACPYFEKVQNIFSEIIDLDYENKLTPEEIQNVNNLGVDFLNNYISRLETYDISQDNAKNLQEEITNTITNFYNNIGKNLKPQLTYLRQEAGLESRGEKKLKELQKETIKTKQEFEKLSEQLRGQLTELSEKKKAIATEKGEIAAEIFGKHFEGSAGEYKDRAENRWYKLGRSFFIALLVLVVLNVVGYLVILIGNKATWWELKPDEFFTPQYGLVKLALFLLISYVIGFASKQYSINSHLAASNVHRKNIAETMKDFYASDLGDQEKSIMIEKATDAMFQNLPIGHISKSENRNDDGPIQNIFSNIPKIKP